MALVGIVTTQLLHASMIAPSPDPRAGDEVVFKTVIDRV